MLCVHVIEVSRRLLLPILLPGKTDPARSLPKATRSPYTATAIIFAPLFVHRDVASSPPLLSCICLRALHCCSFVVRRRKETDSLAVGPRTLIRQHWLSSVSAAIPSDPDGRDSRRISTLLILDIRISGLKTMESPIPPVKEEGLCPLDLGSLPAKMAVRPGQRLTREIYVGSRFMAIGYIYTRNGTSKHVPTDSSLTMLGGCIVAVQLPFRCPIDECQRTHEVETALGRRLERCHSGIFPDGEIHQYDLCDHQSASICALNYCSCCVRS